MPKKGKKGKKGKETGPEPTTTSIIINQREKMLCPRLGDYYTVQVNVETILQDVADKLIKKVAEKKSPLLSLCNMKLNKFPILFNYADDLSSVLELNLSKNNLYDQDQLFSALKYMHTLKKLNLSHNFLLGSLSEAVSGIDELEELILDVNNITELCPEIKYLRNMKVFSISDNSITTLLPEAASWTKLEVLNIKNNKIADIGYLPQHWPELRRLYGGSNLIQVIPYEIGHCKQLKQLDLSANSIQQIPLSLAQCENLEKLHLGSNKIETFPLQVLKCLTKLEELHLYKNKLTTLPSEIGNLACLKKLTLSSNNLKGLPDELGACSTLEELYVNNNAKFSYFPGSGGHLRNLKELSMAKCPALKQLPGTVGELEKLRELDIRGAKKQVCKITPEMVEALQKNRCVIRGGVVKKAKGGKKK